MSHIQKGSIIWYGAYDFIPELEPDPPWTRIPEKNHRFLSKHLTRLIKEQTCPYCNTTMRHQSLGKREWSHSMHTILTDWGLISPHQCETDLFYCTSCGWWSVLQEAITLCSVNTAGSCLVQTDAVYWAKVKAFDTAGLEAPMSHLQATFANNPDRLHRRSGNDLAEWVASSLRDFFPCDVLPIGWSEQDAMETMLIKAEKPAVIRIARSAVDARNRIEIIAEILGIMMLEDRYQGIVVSQLPRTSNGWINPATSPAILDNRALTISLDSYDALIEILQLEVQEETYCPWEEIWSSQGPPYYKDELDRWKARVAKHIRGEDTLVFPYLLDKNERSSENDEYIN